MVVVDTNIIIDTLRRKKDTTTPLLKMLDEAKEEYAISTLTIQELYAGKSTRELKKETEIIHIIEKFIILPYTAQIAQMAGILARDSNKSIEFADAAIAATTIHNNAQLLTLNIKHFAGISGLEILGQ